MTVPTIDPHRASLEKQPRPGEVAVRAFLFLCGAISIATTVGIVYSSGEVNSEVQVAEAEKAAESRGLQIVTSTVTNSSEVQQAAESLDVDAFLIPTDNTVVSAAEAVVQVAEQKQVPVFASDESTMERGAARQVPAQIERRALRRGDRHTVDSDDLIVADAIAARDDASGWPVVGAQQFDRCAIVDPSVTVQRRGGAPGDYASSPGPQPSADGARMQ